MRPRTFSLGEAFDNLSPPRHSITIYMNRKGWRNRRNGTFFYPNHRSPANNLPRSFAEDGRGKLESQFDCGFRLQEVFGAKQNSRVADVLCPPLEPSRSVWFAVMDRNVNRKTPSACRCSWRRLEQKVSHGCISGVGNFLRLAPCPFQAILLD